MPRLMIEPLSDRLRPLKFSVHLSGKWRQRDIINIIAEHTLRLTVRSTHSNKA